jgi:hypothetical protein
MSPMPHLPASSTPGTEKKIKSTHYSKYMNRLIDLLKGIFEFI